MNTNTKLVAGIILGAAAGASLALLLNSEKGKEILNSVKEVAEKATDQVSHLFNKGKEVVEDHAQKYNDVTA